MGLMMDEARTTLAIEQYLVDLAEASGESAAEPIVRAVLSRAVHRLRILCSALLHRSYPRLTRAPVNLEDDELLSAVVERLLKSLGRARPKTVRQFFALANQHMRWELNDVARRLDKGVRDENLVERLFAPESSGSGISLNARRMLEAIDSLPEDEKEIFSLVRIQGLTQPEVAEILGVSLRTVQRRLNRSLVLLLAMLADLHPDGPSTRDSLKE